MIKRAQPILSRLLLPPRRDGPRNKNAAAMTMMMMMFLSLCMCVLIVHFTLYS